MNNNQKVEEEIISLIVENLAIPRKNIETIIEYQKRKKINYLVIVNENSCWYENKLLTGEEIMTITETTAHNLIKKESKFIIKAIKNGEAIHNELGLIKLRKKIKETEMMPV